MMVNAMREMKDSGIAWIGRIPKHWNIMPIKYIKSTAPNAFVDGPFGSNLKSQHYVDDGDVYVIESGFISSGTFVFKEFKTITKEHFTTICRSECKKGDVIIAKIGANYGMAGELPELDKPSVVSGNSLKITLNQDVLANYLFIREMEIAKYFGGFTQIVNETAQPALSLGSLNNFRLVVPPVSEQKRIEEFLLKKCNEIDALSADILSEIETLQEYKRSVITETVTKGIYSHAEMKDSGVAWIGRIPKHWNIKKGKYCLSYVQKPIREDDEVITCFRDGEVTLRSNRREEGFTVSLKEIGYQGIDIGDLVVHGMDGFAGAIGISDSRGKASPVLNVLETDNNKKYIMYYLRNMAYNGIFTALSTGIRVRTCDTNWGKLKELPYLIPPKKEQDEIVNYIDDIISKADSIIVEKQRQLDIIEQYKKSLIYEYVTGKKEVS